jgi:hypothetical protein
VTDVVFACDAELARHAMSTATSSPNLIPCRRNRCRRSRSCRTLPTIRPRRRMCSMAIKSMRRSLDQRRTCPR